MDSRDGADLSSRETLLQQSAALDHDDLSLSPSASSLEPRESVVRRKPVLPRRASRRSLEERLYDVIQMEDIDHDPRPTLPPRPLESPTKKSHDLPEEDLKHDDSILVESLPPKAFRKTHRFLGLNLGYWRMPARHFSIFAALALAIGLPLGYVVQGFNNLVDNGQPPFEYDCYGSSNGWTFIGLNWRFGSFSYGSAKALDLAWNWIVGRGLQGILSIIAYRVFSDALLRVAEMTPLSYELYATISFFSTKPTMIWQLLKGLATQGNWRTKFILSWLVISTVYLLSFPSILDACSGYEASFLAEYQWPNGTFTSVNDLSQWQGNTSVVNMTLVCATWYTNQTSRVRYNFTTAPMNYSDYYDSCYHDGYEISDGIFVTDSRDYELYSWVDPTLNASWNKHQLDDPYDNIPQDWASWNFQPSDPKSFRCITESGVYQWGFSFEWLFVATIVNTCWLLGLWILWLDCDVNGEFCKKGRRLGMWRAIADLSEAMREELGPNICAYTEEELAEALKNRPPVKYYATHGTADKPGHIGLTSRTQRKFSLKWDREYGRRDD